MFYCQIDFINHQENCQLTEIKKLLDVSDCENKGKMNGGAWMDAICISFG